MAYDGKVLEQLRRSLAGLALARDEKLAERKMFGGVCITLNGKMLAGVSDTRLIVRAEAEELVAGEERGVAGPMDLTGRPLKGFAFLYPGKLEPGELATWLEGSASYVRLHMLPKPGAARG